MRTLALGKVTVLEAIAERESIYKLLSHTTPANTSKDYASYTVDPRTRYVTLNSKLLVRLYTTHGVEISATHFYAKSVLAKCRVSKTGILTIIEALNFVWHSV